MCLADEFALHHRHAPVALAADDLGNLMPVAEVAHVGAQLDRRAAVHPGVAGRTGAGEHAHADAVDEPLLQVARREAEQQHAHARTPVRRLVGRKLAVDARLAAAADHRGGEPGHGRGGECAPISCVGAVMMTPLAVIGKASAKVSSIRTPLRIIRGTSLAAPSAPFVPLADQTRNQVRHCSSSNKPAGRPENAPARRMSPARRRNIRRSKRRAAGRAADRSAASPSTSGRSAACTTPSSTIRSPSLNT